MSVALQTWPIAHGFIPFPQDIPPHKKTATSFRLIIWITISSPWFFLFFCNIEHLKKNTSPVHQAHQPQAFSHFWHLRIGPHHRAVATTHHGAHGTTTPAEDDLERWGFPKRKVVSQPAEKYIYVVPHLQSNKNNKKASNKKCFIEIIMKSLVFIL